MAATSQITVNSSGFTAVVTQSYCKNIRILENCGVAGWPTTDFLVAVPLASSPTIRIPSGQAYTFNARAGLSYGVPAGVTVGYVKAVTGSTTVDQDEDLF